MQQISLGKIATPIGSDILASDGNLQ